MKKLTILQKVQIKKQLKDHKRKGRILRLKEGYNPNSSSIGSVVFLLSTKVLVVTSAFGAVAGLIYATFDRKRKEK